VCSSDLILLILAGIAGFWFLFGQKALCTSVPQDVRDAAKSTLLLMKDGFQNDLKEKNESYRQALESGNESAVSTAKVALDVSEALLDYADWLLAKAGQNPEKGVMLLAAAGQTTAVNAVSVYTLTKHFVKQRDAGGPTDLKDLSDLAYADSLKAYASFDQKWNERLLAERIALDAGAGALSENPVVNALAMVCAGEFANGASAYVKEYLDYATAKAEGHRSRGEYVKASFYELNVGFATISLGQNISKEGIEKDYPSFWEVRYGKLDW
jgi:hypothetical protein